jgi:hypothetical protein
MEESDMNTLILTGLLSVFVTSGAPPENPVQDAIAMNLNKEQQEKILELFEASEEAITPDGVLTLIYEFDDEEPEAADDWFPPVQSGVSASLRWANDGRTYSRYFNNGIVLSKSGEWFHTAKWQPQVRMDVEFVSFTTGNSSRKDLVASVFAWSRKNSRRVGSHLGYQLVKISKTKVVAAQGKAPLLMHEEKLRFGFDLEDGCFSTLVLGSKRETTCSKKLLKKLESGQVGMIWSGGVQGVVEQLKITGRLDVDWIQEKIPGFDMNPSPLDQLQSGK